MPQVVTHLLQAEPRLDQVAGAGVPESVRSPTLLDCYADSGEMAPDDIVEALAA